MRLATMSPSRGRSTNCCTITRAAARDSMLPRGKSAGFRSRCGFRTDPRQIMFVSHSPYYLNFIFRRFGAFALRDFKGSNFHSCRGHMFRPRFPISCEANGRNAERHRCMLDKSYGYRVLRTSLSDERRARGSPIDCRRFGHLPKSRTHGALISSRRFAL